MNTIDIPRRSSGLAAPRVFDRILELLQTDAAAHFGTANPRLIPLSYQHRPFSHLLRVGVCLDGGHRPDRHVFVKIFKSKSDASDEKMRLRVVHDFEVSRRIADGLAGWEDLGAVRPVAYYVDHLAIVSEQAEGETLMAHLETHARWFPSRRTTVALIETLSTVGRWLQAFQSIESGAGRIHLSDLRAYIDIRLRRLVAGGVFSAAYRERLLKHLDALAAQVPDSELADVLVHADFAPGNILVSGRRIVVLDFAMLQRGSSLHDIARLYVQLDVLRAKPQFRRTVVRTLQASLLRGFDQTLTSSRPLFRYLVMLHRVNHLGSLSLNREPFLASAFSSRVARLHRGWIRRELETEPGSEIQDRR